MRRGYHSAPLKNLCLTVPMKFVGEPFCVSEEFWYQKLSSKGEGKLHCFVESFFYLARPKKLRQGTILCFKKILVEKNISWIGAGITIFRRKLFVSLYRNISLENTLAFHKNSFIENFHV